MEDKDLKEFGRKLRQLRETEGLTQSTLADELSLIHARINPETDLRIDGNLISKWERAFRDKKRRVWRPKRQHVIYLVERFAVQLSPAEARRWALQGGHQLDENILRKLFPPEAEWLELDSASRPQAETSPRLLAAFPDQHLFGVNELQQRLQLVIERPDPPWIIAIDGIGGIGKTTLANALARQMARRNRFHDIVWVSAKQAEFSPSAGLQNTEQPAFDARSLTDVLLEQLAGGRPLPNSVEERQIFLTTLLKEGPYFIVIDNLETVADYQLLLPVLRKLARPSKFLLTSRHSLYAQGDVFCLSLPELNREDALALIKYEAELRGLAGLVDARPSQLEQVYDVVGGNPLALKLVVGQTHVLPLPQILESLSQAQGKKIEDLYAYIYWQSWHSLAPASRQVLLGMPMVAATGATFSHLSRVSRLEPTGLAEALEELVAFSLVEVSGELDSRRYRIHRLTENFLLKEVIKWSSPR